MVSQKGREMKKLTKQFKGILLVMLCVILMVPHVNANAATQRQQAMTAYKKMLSASRVYVLPNNSKYYDDYYYRTLTYHGSLSKNVYFGLAYINRNWSCERNVMAYLCTVSGHIKTERLYGSHMEMVEVYLRVISTRRVYIWKEPFRMEPLSQIPITD